MDKRSWPWKKKSSDKHTVEKAVATASDSLAAASELDTALAEKVCRYYRWEKAEAEAAALKNHLESVTLLKLTAEDRASHLDGALKECMRQIRNLKEDHEQKLHEVILSKQKLFDKMKLDLESQIADLDQDLMRSAAENAALSRSLQERSNMLVQLTEEKSQAKAEIEILKTNIESWEKEVSSLKYELHIARKEVEIRNEERNMSVRSAEVANRQHLEGAKKIAKLEAECQRLRGLVRKKLPGPAALAQMKLEVESLGRDYGEPRLRRSPVKPPSPHSPQFPEFSLDGSQKYIKENELLTERLLAMEEEMKMLKEALAKRNSELQASRSVYAQTISRLQSLEAHMQANGEPKSIAKGGKPSSYASLSEDGNDDSMSCSGSWTMSEVSHLKKEKNVDSPQKSENASNHLDLMDDFLEMEKLAYLSNGSNGEALNVELSDNTGKSGRELLKNEALVEVAINDSEESPQLRPDPHVFAELQLKISTVLELTSGEKDMEKVAEDIRRVMQDMQETLQLQTVCSGKINSCTKDIETNGQDLQTAIAQIYDFIMILGKETKANIPGTATEGEGLHEQLDTLSAKYSEVLYGNVNPIDFVLDISSVLNKASELHFNVLGFKGSEVETGSSDCIDKIALPENKPDLNSLEERYSANGCARFSDSASDPDVPNNGNLVPTSESTAAPWKCSLEEFEQLKADKDNLVDDLARCMENFENTKSQLLETERILGEVRSQLTLAEKSNSLAETQLKCMAESYKSLETRTDELKSEVGVLQEKIESLESELQEERRCHQEALQRCRDLQEQLERMDCLEAAENDDKTSQEKELAAAAEKLAECQETIFLLGKQLNSLRPQTDTSTPLNCSRNQDVESIFQEEPTVSGMENLQETESLEADTFVLHRAGSESPMDPFNSSYTPSDSDPSHFLRSPVGSKYHPKHRPTNSGSSSASSTPTPEKYARGFSRFFSAKGKN
ncbi:Filament-like plant protein 6 [Striga hermonthica]|uniref:Filament-like plant protein 6 n=1 Tax=Striga hermonthica TaxID=68872 RepID=A0A9N7NXH9_STRHE|nr:Filament-like plant protein 6 [Striga hermonthica]